MSAAATGSLYEIAVDWEGADNKERFALKEFIKGVVGYACKVACKECDGVAEVYVMSDKSGRIEDWIEIHDNGAIWPIEEIYAEKRRRIRDALVTACETYNDEHGVDVPDDEEDEEDDTEDEESSSEESMVQDDDGTDKEEEDDDDDDEEEDESDA